MDRRFLLLGAGAVLAAARPALAQQAPSPSPASEQAPGFYRFKLGDFTVTTVHDGFVRRANPLEGLVTNAPAAEVRAALEAALLPTEGLMNPYIVTFVDTGRGVVAFDAGTGGGQMAPGTGPLPRNMAAAGIRPEGRDARRRQPLPWRPHHPASPRPRTALLPNAEVAVPGARWAW
jgi:hypothetical protein